jgi:lipoprotein-anchoring transpeptidase ErfK/SrfK
MLLIWATALVVAVFVVAGPAGARVGQDGDQPPVDTTPTTTPPVADPPPEPPPPPPPEDPTAKWMNHLLVDLGNQRVNVIANDGTVLRSMPASTGARGATPRGTFSVYSRSPWTTASGNSRVSMQWMTRFKGGIGFHAIPRQGGRPLATPLGIAPVSHGCVRLSDEDAFWLYHSVPNGMPVVVK